MNGTAGNVFGIEVIEANAAVVGVDETIADALWDDVVVDDVGVLKLVDFIVGCVDEVLVVLCMELVALIATCGVLDTGCNVLIMAGGVLMTSCGVGVAACGAMIGVGNGVGVAGGERRQCCSRLGQYSIGIPLSSMTRTLFKPVSTGAKGSLSP